ncbi:hypothetical protein H6P81_004854 [Aristolochia fimbriata]|uniref:Uncharacterized protein n=1 Tax=Aristolochia fimbriata TaxID=158543 RepID=A0AAV7ESU8_ARIFI|nr:hypothetical protein H6P81_004854 [Aristolochia fimbriata]
MAGRPCTRGARGGAPPCAGSGLNRSFNRSSDGQIKSNSKPVIEESYGDEDDEQSETLSGDEDEDDERAFR